MEQHALNIKEKTTTNTNNCYTVGILRDDNNVKICENKNFVLSHLLSLQKKFKYHPTLEMSYKDTMQEYISKGFTSKLSKTEAKRTTPTTNYLPHHTFKNNKPDHF